MSSLPPIKLPYTIRVDQEFHKDPQPTIYDILVSVDDPLRIKLHAFNTNPSYTRTLIDIGKYNEEIAVKIQALAHSKAKHTFFTSLSKDPGTFLRKWTSSQRRDLEVMMGDATRGGGEDATGEEWRRGGPNSVWGTENVRESVNLMLSSRAR
jgi:SWI/SNF-related matrix-associated actin-dependent regulator of chromatin subfamily D